MLFSIFWAVGLAVAATANALLVVPDSVTTSTSRYRSVDLACPSCPPLPVASASASDSHADADAGTTVFVPSHLRLEFAVVAEAHDPAAERLLLNGFELYPRPSWRGPFKAVQVAVPASSFSSMSSPSYSSSEGDAELRDLGYSLAVRPVDGDDHADPGEQLIEVSFRVLEVGDVLVQDVPVVVARMVRSSDGRLAITTVSTHRPVPVGGGVDDGSSSSSSSSSSSTAPATATLSTLREMASQHLAALGEQLSLLRGFGGAHHCRGAASRRAGYGVKGYGSRRHRHRSWRRLGHSVVSYIVLPTVIGVAAGVISSILGMLVASLVTFLWKGMARGRWPLSSRRHLGRRGQRDTTTHDEKPEPVLPPYKDVDAGMV